jgi:hypothetical protein
VALVGGGILLAWDARPEFAPASVHAVLAAVPLVVIAVAYLVYQGAPRRPFREWQKAAILAAAFLFWAANQVWPDQRQAILFNDIAIALFILDVFLVMISRSASAQDESARTHGRESNSYGHEPGSSPSLVTEVGDGRK